MDLGFHPTLSACTALQAADDILNREAGRLEAQAVQSELREIERVNPGEDAITVLADTYKRVQSPCPNVQSLKLTSRIRPKVIERHRRCSRT